MKKFLFSILSAALLIAGCTPEIVKSYDEIKLDSSYVGIPANGGSQTITLTATDSWEISDIPEWLTVNPASGNAGEATISISAEKAEATREAVIILNSAGKQQYINIIQMCEKVDLPISSCADVLGGVDGKVYKVKGAVTAIANTQYGNWYLNDGTGEVYIYGTLDAKGAEKNFLSLGIEVGDIVTCEGPRTDYNGTIELVNVTVIKIDKSLIKVEEKSSVIPFSGGTTDVILTCKGDGVSVEIPEEAKSWLSITGMVSLPKNQVKVSFQVGATVAPRSVEVSFTTNSGSYAVTDKIVQEGNLTGKGTKTEPYTVDDVMKIYEGKAWTDSEVYIAGIITSIKEVSVQYGNAGYYIADEAGVDVANSLYIYRGMYLEGAKFTAEDQIAVGAQVVLKGVISEYKSAVQIAAGNQLVSYTAPGAAEKGSLENPYTAAEAKAEAAKLSADETSKEVYVTGIISHIKEVSVSYGNATFWISEDGTGDEGKSEGEFYIYRNKYYNGEKYTAEDAIKIGDTVVLKGALANYKGNSPQLNANNVIVSINGVTE